MQVPSPQCANANIEDGEMFDATTFGEVGFAPKTLDNLVRLTLGQRQALFA